LQAPLPFDPHVGERLPFPNSLLGGGAAQVSASAELPVIHGAQEAWAKMHSGSAKNPAARAKYEAAEMSRRGMEKFRQENGFFTGRRLLQILRGARP
jgi:hypothetical protein